MGANIAQCPTLPYAMTKFSELCEETFGMMMQACRGPSQAKRQVGFPRARGITFAYYLA